MFISKPVISSSFEQKTKVVTNDQPCLTLNKGLRSIKEDIVKTAATSVSYAQKVFIPSQLLIIIVECILERSLILALYVNTAVVLRAILLNI